MDQEGKLGFTERHAFQETQKFCLSFVKLNTKGCRRWRMEEYMQDFSQTTTLLLTNYPSDSQQLWVNSKTKISTSEPCR